jgi:hypothetical protein
VSVAGLVVADPARLVNTARTSQPFAKGMAIPLKLGEVKVVSDHVDPLSKESCHCTVGVGVLLAAAVKVTVWPEGTVWLMGCVVIVGATGGMTVSVEMPGTSGATAENTANRARPQHDDLP